MSLNDITKNEMNLLLTILKSPNADYNARNLSEKLSISAMGALKIAKKLEKQGILNSKQIGKANIYKINISPDYNKQYLRFLLQRESQQSEPHLKVWINELSKIKHATIIILFGSILKKNDANDIDVLFVTNSLPKLKKEIEEINKVNIKNIHPLFQSKKDILQNIENDDKTLLSALKGVIIKGEDKYIELITK
jgi:DNA-binding Lrp family transcriptional regulator